ncbi:MAG: hypothetical protein ACLFS4_06725 [Opitutales bacterium]
MPEATNADYNPAPPFAASSAHRLRLQELSYRDLMAYPLTGGYSKPQMCPAGLVRCLLPVEARLPQFLLRRLGLRMRIVLEKVGGSA